METCQTKDHERWIGIPDSQIMAEVALMINAKTILDLLYEKTGWKKTEYSNNEKTFKKGKNGFFF